MKSFTYGQIAQELKRINTDKPWLIVLIGLPGSGKSTFVQKLSEDFHFCVASTDNLIEREAKKLGLTYSEAFGRLNQKHLKREMDQNITDAVNKGENIINDQTNMGSKKRKGLNESINDSAYVKIALTFDVKPEILKERLDKRAAETGKVIPHFVIANMTSNYVTPTKAEGFNEIWALQQ